MSRRFVPPAVAVLAESPDADFARAMAGAREEAFAEGREAGLKEGYAAGQREGHEVASAAYQTELAELEQKFAKQQAILTITTALEQVLAARAGDLRDLEDATRATIVEALRLIFPSLLEHSAGQEVAALVTAALTDRAAEQLVLRANPATLRLAAIDELPGEQAARLTMQEASDMALGAAEIVWTGGGLTLDPAALQARATAILLPGDKEPIE